LKDLGQLKGQEVWIILEVNNPICKWTYRLSEVEKALVQAWTVELLDLSLVELSKGEYVSTTVMLTKIYIFGNWTKNCMCEDCHLVNKQTHLDKYSMLLLENIFDVLGQSKV